jgi:hypothetical protein
MGVRPRSVKNVALEPSCANRVVVMMGAAHTFTLPGSHGIIPNVSPAKQSFMGAPRLPVSWKKLMISPSGKVPEIIEKLVSPVNPQNGGR